MGTPGLLRNTKKMNETSREMDLTQHAAGKTNGPHKSHYDATHRIYENITFSYFSFSLYFIFTSNQVSGLILSLKYL